MPHPVPLTLLLKLDGVVYSGDLAVQAFARHVAAAVPAEQGRAVLAGMRGFLEGKPELLRAGLDLAGDELLDAEDGDQAVDLLAAAAGLGRGDIERAWRQSRIDLAGSAWIVEPCRGLAEMMRAIAGKAEVDVVTVPQDPAVDAVLAACDLAGNVQRVLALPIANAIGQVLPAVDHDAGRLLVIGTRWSGELDAANAAGARTALVDRFERGRGRPDGRATDLRGLLDMVRSWIPAQTNPAW